MTRDPPVELTVDDETWSGRAFDLRDRSGGTTRGADSSLSPETVVAAVRADASVEGLSVACPPPREVHAHVGVVTPETTLSVRPALAAAARSRGLSAPQDDEIAAVREEISAVEVPDEGEAAAADPAAARRRLADTGADVDRLRERVATLRGRVQAAREAGREAADVEADLAEATRALSEAETERVAAREALERAERRAREARDARERRRRLQDRAANLERAARAHLVERVRPAYRAAVDAVSGPTPSDPFDAGPVTGALAVARVADLRAPVVLGCGRFGSAAAAAEWLEAPVVRV